MNNIISGYEKKSIWFHKKPNMFVVSDRNWTQWPSKPVQDMGWEIYNPASAAVFLRAWNSMASCDYAASLGQGKDWSQPSWSLLQLTFLSWLTYPYLEMIFNVQRQSFINGKTRKLYINRVYSTLALGVSVAASSPWHMTNISSWKWDSSEVSWHIWQQNTQDFSRM